MKKEIKVYKRENWQIWVSSILILILFINLSKFVVTYKSHVPNLLILPFMLSFMAFLLCITWLMYSLEKRPYTMIIEEINSKEQKITYKKVKE